MLTLGVFFSPPFLMNPKKPNRDWELEIGGLRVPLSAPATVLGRDPSCDLPLQDELASWQHLRIEVTRRCPVLTDLGSRNGTYVAGKRIDGQPTPIKHEAIIQIGSTRARIREVLTGVVSSCRGLPANPTPRSSGADRPRPR